MLLTNIQATRVLGAFLSIEDSMSSDNSGSERIRMSHNIGVLSRRLDNVAAAKRKMFMEISGGKDGIDQKDEEKVAELKRRSKEIDLESEDTKLWSIDYSSFNPDQVKPSSLEALVSIIKGIPDVGAPDL